MNITWMAKSWQLQRRKDVGVHVKNNPKPSRQYNVAVTRTIGVSSDPYRYIFAGSGIFHNQFRIRPWQVKLIFKTSVQNMSSENPYIGIILMPVKIMLEHANDWFCAELVEPLLILASATIPAGCLRKSSRVTAFAWDRVHMRHSLLERHRDLRWLCRVFLFLFCLYFLINVDRRVVCFLFYFYFVVLLNFLRNYWEPYF